MKGVDITDKNYFQKCKMIKKLEEAGEVCVRLDEDIFQTSYTILIENVHTNLVRHSLQQRIDFKAIN